MNSSPPNIVCAADNRYAIPLAVMLRSIEEHLGEDCTATVWILDGGITPENRRKIVRSLPARHLQIHWMSVDAGLLAGMPVFGHVSLSTYYRFLLGAILPPEIERVIYLDVDIIVFGDIVELWNTPMENRIVLAVPERNSRVADMLDPAIISGAGLNAEGNCFNAGVMLIDLARWRAENLLERARAFVNQYKTFIRYWDQDILNCLLVDEWGELDGKWNRKVDHLDGVDVEACQKAGGLIHFASAIKPWTWWADHSAKSLYLSWVDLTAWRGWRPRAPLRSMVANKHWYGKWIRRIPVIGFVWRIMRERSKDQGRNQKEQGK